jgi:predicted PurR-regulated permease PerM
MSRIYRAIESLLKVLLLCAAAFAFLAVLASWLLAAWLSTKTNVAFPGRQILYLDIGAFAIASGCLMAWAWIRKHGLARSLAVTLLALVVSLALVILTTLSTARDSEFSAVPENLNYEFLAHRNPSQYSTWSQPATSENVERWHLIRYGFPVTFLHMCRGLTVAGQYVMIDWYRLLFDCVLAFVVSFAVVTGMKALVRWIQDRGRANTA